MKEEKKKIGLGELKGDGPAKESKGEKIKLDSKASSEKSGKKEPYILVVLLMRKILFFITRIEVFSSTIPSIIYSLRRRRHTQES